MVGTTSARAGRPAKKKDPGPAAGPHREQPRVNFDGTDHSLIGEFVDVQITEALPNSLRGDLCATANDLAA